MFNKKEGHPCGCRSGRWPSLVVGVMDLHFQVGGFGVDADALAQGLAVVVHGLVLPLQQGLRCCDIKQMGGGRRERKKLFLAPCAKDFYWH